MSEERRMSSLSGKRYYPQTHVREAALGKYHYESALEKLDADGGRSGVCLLVIDMQKFCSHPTGGQFEACKHRDVDPHGTGKYSYFFKELQSKVIPNVSRILAACRNANEKVEIIYTVIESLTLDGRDRSLDYKISGFNVAKGSVDAQVIDPIRPLEDEIVIPKSSSSVFISTNIDYLLKNLGIRQIIMTGQLTDQCVESAVRDACDLGYLVTLVSDGTITHSAERHQNSLKTIKGYCRQRTTEEILEEIENINGDNDSNSSSSIDTDMYAKETDHNKKVVENIFASSSGKNTTNNLVGSIGRNEKLNSLDRRNELKNPVKKKMKKNKNSSRKGNDEILSPYMWAADSLIRNSETREYYQPSKANKGNINETKDDEPPILRSSDGKNERRQSLRSND